MIAELAEAVTAMREKEWRAAELGRLALRPPGIIALLVLIMDVAVAVAVTGFGSLFFLVILAVVSGLVLGWCIGRVVRDE